MPQPLNPDIVNQLINDPAFQEYIRWATQVIGELNSVDDLEGKTNETAGEEAKVRAKSINKLHQILSPFIEYRIKREPTLVEFKKAKDTYGL
jgi:hypothetical protein